MLGKAKTKHSQNQRPCYQGRDDHCFMFFNEFQVGFVLILVGWYTLIYVKITKKVYKYLNPEENSHPFRILIHCFSGKEPRPLRC